VFLTFIGNLKALVLVFLFVVGDVVVVVGAEEDRCGVLPQRKAIIFSFSLSSWLSVALLGE
jgi:hypothetical protein